ncbi:fimbrial protein [Dyella acidiphila]|uniref:Type 1 fimbrial protein n=1 Tax=Dyella acidiphila TaxID=2775866 RepID=A0ABR9G5Q1_9GAMM|nr:fimbrial protein [Dyella acidiphila]MBE1159376.1 type 1 fimbrial protein [Dyella acidiphila]
MKKTIITAALLTAFGVAALAPLAASATDGTITINGKISSSTCTINGNGSGSSSFTVTLPTVAASALASTGAVAGDTPFSLVLSGCTFSASGTVSTYFEPGANVLADGNLKNNGSATGVEVQLLNSGNTAIALGSASGSQNASTAAVTTSSTGATLNYFAQYVVPASSTKAVAGSVTTTVNYDITYP